MRNSGSIAILILAAVLALAGCSDNRKPPVSIPPTVNILHPSDGAELLEPVTIEIEATDNAAIAYVFFYLDGELFAEFTEPPYEVYWNVGYWGDGDYHTLFAEAYDPTYNYGSSEVIEVFVPTQAGLRAELEDPEPTDPDTKPYELSLTWHSLPDAELYEMQMTPNGGGLSGPSHVISTADTTVTLQALAAGSYSWKVRAQEINGRWSAWSIPDIFTMPAAYCRSYGGTAEDAAYDIQRTADGGFILAGYSDAEGGDARSLWLLKLNSQGDQLWEQRIGDQGEAWAYAVRETQDNGFIAVGHSAFTQGGDRDLLLLKTDAGGVEQWRQNFGGAGDDGAFAVGLTQAGDYAIAGYTTSMGAGEADLWLLLYDAQGDSLVWERSLGGAAWDEGRALQVCTDGNFAIAGSTRSQGAGSEDAWLLKAEAADGDVIWERTFGGASWDGAYDLRECSDEGFIATGFNGSWSQGGLDLWLIKTDAQGIEEWNQVYGGAGWEVGYSLRETGDGYAVAGYSNSQGQGDYDLWLLKTNAQGEHSWDLTLGGGFDDRALAMEIAPDGFLAGGYSGSFSAGDFDLWLVKSDPSGAALTLP